MDPENNDASHLAEICRHELDGDIGEEQIPAQAVVLIKQKSWSRAATAYETLKDTKKRAEYDAIGEIPPSMAPLFNEAQWCDHLGRHSKAAELYQTILKRHPELDNVREQYAKSLTKDEKTGKAADVWEELCRRNPSHVHYSEKLAECYFDRGWHKKAEVEVKRAITLDPDSLDAWSLFLDCIVAKVRATPDKNVVFDELSIVVQEALKTVTGVKENEWKKIYLYSHAFTTSPEKTGALPTRAI
ncbi:hypothetical protein AGMMS50293_17420 [Spirochaetia bacterium]|nr:hypothetical protein AGMMS50293_17420 [Spirochaetia bacterium]